MSRLPSLIRGRIFNTAATQDPIPGEDAKIPSYEINQGKLERVLRTEPRRRDLFGGSRTKVLDKNLARLSHQHNSSMLEGNHPSQSAKMAPEESAPTPAPAPDPVVSEATVKDSGSAVEQGGEVAMESTESSIVEDLV